MTLYIGFLLVAFSLGMQQTDAYTWCCKSEAELQKCQSFSGRPTFDNTGRLFDFDCVLGDSTVASSTASCVELIKQGQADVIDLDGGDIFDYRDDVKVIAAEDVGEGDASYYAVAVVKKNAHVDKLTLHNIANYRTCHTGVGKTSGWNMPMGWFIRKGINAANIQASCAPGAMSSRYATLIPGGVDSKWCELCIGNDNGKHKCDRDNDERFYGYQGAFRCMKSGAGDVAFIKHTIVPQDEAGEYELLCPDSPRRASPLDWRNCNIGRVPSHAVVMGNAASAADAAAVNRKLNFAQNSISEFLTYGGKNLLWGSSVRKFIAIEEARQAPRQYLGNEYFCNTYALLNGSPHRDCRSA